MASLRGGTDLFIGDPDTQSAGVVTSGGFGVSLDAPIAMGYVRRNAAEPGRHLLAKVRSKPVDLVICPLPFITPHYRR